MSHLCDHADLYSIPNLTTKLTHEMRTKILAEGGLSTAAKCTQDTYIHKYLQSSRQAQRQQHHRDVQMDHPPNKDESSEEEEEEEEEDNDNDNDDDDSKIGRAS